MRKLKHRPVKSLDPGCTDFEWQSWDSDPGCLLPSFAFLSKMLYCPPLWGETSNITNVCSFSSWSQNIDKRGKLWATSHNHSHALWSPVWCAVYGNVGFVADTDCTHISFSCHHQSVCTCSPASGTTVLITACTEAIAERPSGKVCLSCMGTEASTMMRSSQLSKRSMKQSEM